MPKNNKRRSAPQHINVLRDSPPEAIRLGFEVEQRFLDLLGSWKRVRGVELLPPRELDADLVRWRAMRVRHKRGDYRSSEAEHRSMEAVMLWALEMNTELRGQQPPEKKLVLP